MKSFLPILVAAFLVATISLADTRLSVSAPPKATIETLMQLEGEFMKIAKLPDVASRLKAIGVDAVGTSTKEFTKILASDIARWGDVVKSANIKIEQ